MSLFRSRSAKSGRADWERCRDWLAEVTKFTARSVTRVSSERELYSYLKVRPPHMYSPVPRPHLPTGAGRHRALQDRGHPHPGQGARGDGVQDSEYQADFQNEDSTRRIL